MKLVYLVLLACALTPDNVRSVAVSLPAAGATIGHPDTTHELSESNWIDWVLPFIPALNATYQRWQPKLGKQLLKLLLNHEP